MLAARPPILPRRHFVYPAEVEEVERGALELMVRPAAGEAFLATCALGFASPAVPTGVWSCPDPAMVCAVAGGYGYMIDSRAPGALAADWLSARNGGASDSRGRAAGIRELSLGGGMGRGGTAVANGAAFLGGGPAGRGFGKGAARLGMGDADGYGDGVRGGPGDGEAHGRTIFLEARQRLPVYSSYGRSSGWTPM